MPWTIERRDGQYCVIKTSDGENEGCHPNRDEAIDHMRALYASEDVKEATEAELAAEFAPEEDEEETPPTSPASDSEEDDEEDEESSPAQEDNEEEEEEPEASSISSITFSHATILVQTLEDEIKFAVSGSHMKDMEEIAGTLRALADKLLGYHEEEPEPAPAEIEYAEEDAIEADIAPLEYSPTEYAWEGEIVFEEQMTGDNRIFKEGSISWDDATLPWPFRWQRSAIGGHDGAVTIGRVDRLERKEDAIYAYGVILAVNPEAWEYLDLLRAGAAGGVSVDGDSAELEIIEPEDAEGTPHLAFSSMRLRSLTAVDIPAFNNAKIKLSNPDSLTAAAVGDMSLPMAERTERWDGYANQKALFEWAKTDEGVDPAKMKRAFLWQDSDGDPNLKGSYKLPFVKIVNGTLTAVPKAIFAAASALEGARGGVKIPDADKVAIRKKVSALYSRIPGEPKAIPPWNRPEGDAAADTEELAKKRKKRKRRKSYTYDAEALTAAAIPIKPPVEWFLDPELEEPTPLTVTPEGEVFGHIALFDTCHIGFQGSCVTPPRNATYSYFHTGEVEAAEGECVAVGHLTFNTGHAALDDSPAQAAAHYDHTGKVAADVRAGEDKFGIWVAGAMRPTISDEDIRAFRAAPVSGDWRRIGGRMELVAALSVNTPGFPVPRTRVLVAGGEAGAMISSPPDFEETRIKARKQIKARIAASLRSFK